MGLTVVSSSGCRLAFWGSGIRGFGVEGFGFGAKGSEDVECSNPEMGAIAKGDLACVPVVCSEG